MTSALRVDLHATVQKQQKANAAKYLSHFKGNPCPHAVPKDCVRHIPADIASTVLLKLLQGFMAQHKQTGVIEQLLTAAGVASMPASCCAPELACKSCEAPACANRCQVTQLAAPAAYQSTGSWYLEVATMLVIQQLQTLCVTLQHCTSGLQRQLTST